MAQTLHYLIIVIVIAGYLFSIWLAYLNQKNKRTQLPEALEDIYDQAEYEKSQHYDKAKTRLSILTTTLSTLIILLLLFFNGFARIDAWVGGFTDSPVWTAVLFFGVLAIASDIISLPFSLYGTFVLEEKYGFNKTTVKTFILDKIKGYLLGALIGGGLLALLVWIYYAMPAYFWLIGWLVITVFTIFMAMFYTTLLVPVFNKLSPLEDEELKQAIQQYAEKVNFSLKNISVIDGSKRSTKANAYFSGLGPKKSIVLFDTLLEKHSKEELVAILAHEVGHYKKKHVQKGMLLGAVQSLIIFYILGWVLGEPAFSEALGVAEPSFHIGIVAFGLLYSPISTVTGILMNMISRKNEFEADAFAAKTDKPGHLVEALKKLSRDNLSDLEPHPFYVFVHYSHPPVLERIRVLNNYPQN
jgi:STE24 endopeptidase